jgi:flagellar motor component MotA
MSRVLTVAVSLLLIAGPAHAYIGPGVGAGLIATVMGILTAIGLAVIAIVWYPIKRLLRRNGPSSKAVKPVDDLREP